MKNLKKQIEDRIEEHSRNMNLVANDLMKGMQLPPYMYDQHLYQKMGLEDALFYINQAAENVGELSDGYHTFNSLYDQRMYLFATIINLNPTRAWKSYKHDDGELCFGGGWFIVGVDTPEGSYTYHYENKYWDLFNCIELDVGKPWDGHTDKDVKRMLSLKMTKDDKDILESRRLEYIRTLEEENKILKEKQRKMFDIIDMNLGVFNSGEVFHRYTEPQMQNEIKEVLGYE